MSDTGTGRTTTWWCHRAVAALALAGATLVAGAGSAAAHGGDSTKIHGCIAKWTGHLSIVGPNGKCQKHETALDWSATDTNTTYEAGAGLSLTGNVFSIASVPWSALTGVPAGLDDGDDVGGPSNVQWGDIDGVPDGLDDGDDVGLTEVAWDDINDIPGGFADDVDDDGSTKVDALKTQLGLNDGEPDESFDLVSFSRLKDLANRVTSGHIENGTIRTHDLAGSDAEAVSGSVTSDKILDGSIEGRDLSANVVHTNDQHYTPIIDIPAGTRHTVTLTVPGVQTRDLVTVSPPPDLEGGLIFTGSDVLVDGQVTIYLYNAGQTTIESLGPMQLWKVRFLNTNG